MQTHIFPSKLQRGDTIASHLEARKSALREIEESEAGLTKKVKTKK